MLKPIAVMAGVILAIAGSPAAVQAANFFPNDFTLPVSFRLTGSLTLQQTTTIHCAVRLDGMIAPGGAWADITSGSFTGGDWQCGWLVNPNGFPWFATASTPSRVSISGISANTIAGSCSGSLSYMTWSVSPLPSGVILSFETIPGSPNACTITGTLTSSPTISIM